MVDKTSHHEYLATYVDDILIWSMDQIAVVKSMEKTYITKSVGTPEYYLGGNVEFLGESWIRISCFCKDLHPKCHSEI
jgi:hypothetical protein